MKVTFILRNMSESFFRGSETLPGIYNLKPDECYKYLNERALKPEYSISKQVESGQFKDKVALNQILHAPYNITHLIETRKGYKLATFNIVEAA